MAKINTLNIFHSIKNQKHPKIDLSNCTVYEFNFLNLKRKWLKIHPDNEFIPDIIARNAIFTCCLNIPGEYLGYVNFSHTQFLNGLCFDGTTFCNEVNFNAAILFNKASFISCSFEEKATFHSSTFKSTISFTKTSFHALASFMKSQFVYAPDFRRVQFMGLSFFKHINVEHNDSIFLFNDAKFEGTVRFSDLNCRELRLDRCINYALMDFEPMDDSDKRSIKLLSIHEMINLGQINLQWEESHVKNLIGDNPSYTFKSKAKQFSVIKENYHSLGLYDSEDKAFLAHMRFKQKELLKNKKFLSAFGYKVIDSLGEYGVNPTRVAVVMFFTFVFFALFHIALCLSCGNIFSLQLIWDCILNSSFSLIGIGYNPLALIENHIFLFLIALESSIGYFLLSYFLVAIVRRTLR